MKPIDIFYQGHGIADVDHIEAEADQTVAAIKALLVKKHGWEPDTLIFLEYQEEPLGDHVSVKELAGPGGAKLHLHRCRQVIVAVTFAGETVRHPFSPATTVGRVKIWAAVKKFGMTEDEAGEHLLQIAGTQDRPAPGTHIGRLVAHPHCKIHFDLVPDERINGAPVGDDSEDC